MLVSTKGRYALRVMIDLAEHYNGDYIPMKDIASRQELSQKYMERIMPMLVKGSLVEAIHGKGGGYRLKKDPISCTVGEVLRLTEGDLAPVACLEQNANPCERAAECRTLPMWKKLADLVNDYFDSVTLSDLMLTDTADNYVI